MIEQSVSLASNGVVKVPGYEQLVRFGYTKNRGVYRLTVTATGEWEGLTIRCFWHVPDGKDPASSLVVDGAVDVPASVTAQPGNGCITFEGSDGTKTVTSADLRYRVSANSGTEDGTEPEPGTPAWQQLVDAVHTDAAAAEQAKTDAQNAANQAGATAGEAAASAKNAGQSAKQAADSLQELKDGIASGDFKGEPGTSPTVTVQDIAGGHRIVITDATGTSSVDVMDGKQGDPGKPGNTGATPEFTIGTVEEGDAPSATITGTAKNPVLNLTLKSGAPGKDATVDATLSQSGKAADAKVTGDELARKAVIDDTTVGTDAWSSKHIVDMLCPPLEESGNPVVCYPVENYPLGVVASFEPTREGTGDPSPENVRPIKGRNSVTVTRCGENCFDFSRITTDQFYAVDYENKTISVPAYTNNAGYVDTLSDLCPGIIPGILIISARVSNPTAQKLIYILDTKKAIEFGKPYTLTSDDLSSTFSWYNGPDQPVQNVISDIQVTYGTAAPTTYAPYTGQTSTMTLPRTIYGGTVDAVTGEGQKTWKLVTLDGTERWIRQDNATNNYSCDIKPAANSLTNCLCSMLPWKMYAYASKGNEGYFAFESSGERVHFCTTETWETVDAWKSYLAAQYAAGTPVQIAYKLATPTPFTATGAQPVPALSGVNTVLTDADSVTVTGRADPIKRITELEDAVASMTNT